MPTDNNKKTTTAKKESSKKEIKGRKFVQPTKFILHISKCGTDTINSCYKLIEHDNPILLGLNGVKIMCDGFAPKEVQPFYQYLLACSILRGLEFDKAKLFDDIDNIVERIKNLSLKSLKGGSINEEP